MYEDYKIGIKDVGEVARSRPKTSIAFTLLSALGVGATKSNPSESHFRETVIKLRHGLLTTDELRRNEAANEHSLQLERCFNYGLVRRTSFGLFSIVWLDNHDKSYEAYRGRCKHVRVRWREWNSRVLDVGFLSRWWYLGQAIESVDSNSKYSERDFPPGLCRDVDALRYTWI